MKVSSLLAIKSVNAQPLGKLTIPSSAITPGHAAVLPGQSATLSCSISGVQQQPDEVEWGGAYLPVLSMGRFIDGSQTSTVLANNPANCFSASCTFVFSSTEVMAAVRLDIVGR